MIDRLEQARVFERFPLARLKREHQGRIGGISDRHGEPLQKRKGLVPQSRLLDLHATGTDEVVQNLVQQDEVRAFRQQLKNLVCPRGDSAFVLGAKDFVAFLSAKGPGNPAPHRSGPEILAGDRLPVGRVEELAVKDGSAHLAGSRQSLSLRDHVHRLTVSGGVHQPRQRVRLAAAECSNQLQHAVACGPA